MLISNRIFGFLVIMLGFPQITQTYLSGKIKPKLKQMHKALTSNTMKNLHLYVHALLELT
jgi:hypothetical protein